MIMYRRMSWWYWLASSVLLTIGLFVWFPAFYILIALSAVQVFHYSIRDNSITSFPVQVRIAYLIWMVVALWEPLRFLYWIPFVGTWAMVLTGYCFLARCMSLLPWNRNEQISPSLLKRTFFSPPVKGSIKHGHPEEQASKGHA